MAAMMFFEGPEPVPGTKWCVVCSRLYKGAYLSLPHVASRVNEFNKLDASEVRFFKIEFPKGKEPMLAVAVTTALYPMPYQALGPQATVTPCDVCWTHTDALIMKDGLLAFRAQDMPAQKGGVLLGGRGG
jgi:hypothetical protein